MRYLRNPGEIYILVRHDIWSLEEDEIDEEREREHQRVTGEEACGGRRVGAKKEGLLAE